MHKDGAIKMIRKIALRLVAATLIAFMAFNAYLAINHLRLIRKAAALTLPIHSGKQQLREIRL